MKNTDNVVIPIVRHEIWAWPAVINLIAGGMAAGFFLFGLLEADLLGQIRVSAFWMDYRIISPVLVVCGFIAVGAEAGKPLHAIFLLHHIKRSWMSREVLAGFLLIGFALLDWLHPSSGLKVASAVSALGLLVCQGFMVYRAQAVVAWNRVVILCNIIASGLAGGFGLLLIWMGIVSNETVSLPALLTALMFLLVGLVSWFVSIRPTSNPNADPIGVHLRDSVSMALSIGLGMIIPILALIAVMLHGRIGGYVFGLHWYYLLVGLCIITGNVLQKTALILQGNALHAITLGSPQRHVPACHT